MESDGNLCYDRHQLSGGKNIRINFIQKEGCYEKNEYW